MGRRGEEGLPRGRARFQSKSRHGHASRSRVHCDDVDQAEKRGRQGEEPPEVAQGGIRRGGHLERARLGGRRRRGRLQRRRRGRRSRGRARGRLEHARAAGPGGDTLVPSRAFPPSPSLSHSLSLSPPPFPPLPALLARGRATRPVPRRVATRAAERPALTIAVHPAIRTPKCEYSREPTPAPRVHGVDTRTPSGSVRFSYPPPPSPFVNLFCKLFARYRGICGTDGRKFDFLIISVTPGPCKISFGGVELCQASLGHCLFCIHCGWGALSTIKFCFNYMERVKFNEFVTCIHKRIGYRFSQICIAAHRMKLHITEWNFLQ